MSDHISDAAKMVPDGYYNALVQGDTGGEMHQVVRVHGGRVYTAHPYELKPSACSQFTPLETQSYCTHWPQLAAGELEALRTANAALVGRVKRLEEVLNRILDNNGSRNQFRAISLYDAQVEAEKLLAGVES